MAQNSTALEYAVEAHFVKRVRELGGISLKTDKVQGRKFLDRVAFMPAGRTIIAEFKRPKGGRFEPHQIGTLLKLKQMGHRDVWVLTTKEEVEWCLTNPPMNSSAPPSATSGWE